jgi:hypothetical protein
MRRLQQANFTCGFEAPRMAAQFGAVTLLPAKFHPAATSADEFNAETSSRARMISHAANQVPRGCSCAEITKRAITSAAAMNSRRLSFFVMGITAA